MRREEFRIQNSEKEKRLKQKVSFYYQEKLICHVTKEPKGFVNGWFRSDLQDGGFYWFEDQRWEGEKVRLFLVDIFNINDLTKTFKEKGFNFLGNIGEQNGRTT